MKLLHLLWLGLFAPHLCLAQQVCFGGNIPPAISGRYADNYGGNQIVNIVNWISLYPNYPSWIFHVCLTNNPNRDLIAQNDGANQNYTWKFSRFEWVYFQNSLYYCQQVYDADTIQGAIDAPRANSSNPPKDGCGANNFPWTGLTLVPSRRNAPTCSGGEENPSIAGNYIDNYGGTQIVDQFTWETIYPSTPKMIFHICSTNNSAREIIAQNDAQNPYYPLKYSRFEWTFFNFSLWYCQQVYNADTIEEAENYPRANASNPAKAGCGVPANNFPWTQLIPAKHRRHREHFYNRGKENQPTCSGGDEIPSIAGKYIDNYGGTQIVDQYTWQSDSLIFHICSTDNAATKIIAQNDAQNQWYPLKYSRFEWTFFNFSLWYCQQVYDANTIEEAESYPRADSSNPAKGGCGAPTNNFPWTRMIKVKPRRVRDQVYKSQAQPTCSGGDHIPSIAGRYIDNYGNSQIVTKRSWKSGSSIWPYCSTDNHNREIIAQNGAHNGYAPGKYSRFEWVRVASSHTLWYCQQVYNADTIEEATNYPRADSSNPSVGGCGIPDNNFPWSQLLRITPKPEVSTTGKEQCNQYHPRNPTSCSSHEINYNSAFNS